jgi:predicted lipoprotein with Yx(FWY)xxD motif
VSITIGVAAGLSSTAIAGTHAKRTKIELRKTSVGTILVTSRGFTIYVFTKDKKNHDACAAIAHCESTWPPVVTVGKPVAGKGLKSSLFGTIKVKGLKKNQRQVTYAGHPLYTYIADSKPGQTTYVNFDQFGGHWPAINSAGHEVK